MRISLLTCGTRGDAQPMVVLGHELIRRGHDVVLGVSPNVIEWCERAGLTALPFGPDSEAFMRSPRGQEWLAAGNVRAFMRALSAEAHEHAATSRAELGAPTKGADLVVAGLLAEDFAAVAAEAADVPLVTLHSAPVRRTSACAAPLVTAKQLPGPVNRLTHRLFERVWWKGVRDDVAELRREWRLPPARTTTAHWLAAQAATEVQASCSSPRSTTTAPGARGSVSSLPPQSSALASARSASTTSSWPGSTRVSRRSTSASAACRSPTLPAPCARCARSATGSVCGRW